uniref:Uncharacterized protein n=1 Tax=Schistocephalus solidus TaxID=70667 RepID=A0A0X3PXX9_SCHSO
MCVFTLSIIGINSRIVNRLKKIYTVEVTIFPRVCFMTSGQKTAQSPANITPGLRYLEIFYTVINTPNFLKIYFHNTNPITFSLDISLYMPSSVHINIYIYK